MPDTAPVPNIVPIPGMNQGTVIAGGSGGSGGDDANANDGSDKEGAGGGSGGDDASADNKNAPDYEKYPTCGTESHPVDVVTGRVFTHPIVDLHLPGPLPFIFQRSYSSAASKQDQGLGYGWAHSLGWFVEVSPRRVTVWNEKGVSVSFPVPQIGHSVQGDWGWVLRRELWGFAVDALDDVWRTFSTSFDEGKTFRLTAIDDQNKNRIALTYADGKLVEVKDSAGRIVKVKSTKEGRIASLEVKNAEHHGKWIAFAQYLYDEKGRLVRVTDADGHSWTYAYDDFNRLVRDTDRAGLSFCFRYDEKDRGIEAWGEYAGKKDPSLADNVPKFLADGRTRAKGIFHRKFDYHARGYTEVTDTTETRRYQGNSKGMLEKAVTGGAVTSSKYDNRGFEIEKTDPMGATTRWVRDGRGRVLEKIDPLGRRTQIERDVSGWPVRVVDANGGVWQAHRDQRGNIESLQDAAGAASFYTYDQRGLVTSVTDPLGARTTYGYDAQGSVVEIVQPNGGRWTLTYDALGRRTSVRDPTGAQTRYALSDRGDLLAQYDAAGGVRRYAFDGEQHLTQIVSPKGNATHFTWGGFNALCTRRDANDHALRLAYSREGELIEIHNARQQVQRIRYDAAARLVEEETFDGRTLRVRNDAAGRVVRLENGAGEVTVLVYDLAGQLVERELPDDTKEAFEYNGRGELVRAVNGAGEYRFERDPVGRIVREVQTVGDEEHWVEVTYDKGGNRIGRKTSLGHTEEVKRDASGARLTTLLDGEHNVEHATDVLGREVARRLPGGGVVERAFDAMGRIAERLVRSGVGGRPITAGEPEWLGKRDDGVTAATSYQYDADGEIAGKHDRARGATRYEYDPIGQLLAAIPEKVRAEVFRYDAAGNVYEGGSDQEPRSYDAGNRLLRKGNTEYEWDGDGRLARKVEHAREGDRVWVYTWNGAGHLRTIEMPDGRTVDFTYDPFFRRTSKTLHVREGLARKVVETTRFVWDSGTIAHEVRAGGTNAATDERTYCFEDGSFIPSAQRGGERPAAPANPAKLDDVGTARPWFHYVTDPSGAPDRLVDDHGDVVCALQRSAWGIHEEGARASTPIRFQGQYEDYETGLYYNRARYYEPDSGRFISADPIDISGGTNVFAYARNPIRWADPCGLDPDYQVGTAPGTAWFWSGRVAGVGVGVNGGAAQQLATANGGTTLEQLMAKRGTTPPDWINGDSPEAKANQKQWGDASEQYAKGCSGDVHVVLGEKPLRPGNVWETRELGALKANPAVTRIIEVDPTTKAQTVIYTRGS